MTLSTREVAHRFTRGLKSISAELNLRVSPMSFDCCLWIVDSCVSGGPRVKGDVKEMLEASATNTTESRVRKVVGSAAVQKATNSPAYHYTVHKLSKCSS